jgi:23S rRNA (guanosine2251-2'-O)-methyltransferase
MNEKRRPQGRDKAPRRDNAPRRADRFADRTPVEEVEGQLEGRNALTEALKSGRTIDKVFVADGDTDRGLQRLAAQAKEAGAVVVPVDRRKLDQMSTTRSHQGIIALAAEKDYVEPEDILRIAEERGEPPLIAIADGITDPYNLGALIRCAEGLGAHGLIIPKRRAVGLTPLVTKASAGAIEHLAVAKVTNLAQTVKMLQERGVWVYAAEAGGSDYDKTNFRGPCALIFGSEGDGVSALLKERCDGIVSIPMKGKVNSFNVSTAAAILLAEAARQHRMAAIEQGGEG